MNPHDRVLLLRDVGHHGLTLVHRHNGAARGLRATAIAVAVTRVGTTFADGIADRVIVLLQFVSSGWPSRADRCDGGEGPDGPRR
jgi:hypothetical protein